tara:strand:+ start:346 stop:639 length:294 start_codon:yes stop_codon:yes gene_type:complete
MNIKIGFSEVALVTSLFFFQQSWWIGVILLSISLLAKGVTYSIKYSEEQEKKSELKRANELLKQSIHHLMVSEPGEKKKTPASPTLIFNNPNNDIEH